MMFHRVRMVLGSCGLALAILLSGCVFEVPPAAPPTLDEDCVLDYDEDTDYFPHKTEVQYSQGFDISYFNNYKVLEVFSPWPGSESSEIYLLVQCGTPRPAGYDDAHTIEIPVDSMVTLSTTYLPHLEILDEVETLVGVENDAWIYSEVIRKRVQEGAVQVVGGGATIDLETVLVLNPDVIIAFSMGFLEGDAHPVLRAADQTVFLNSEFREPTPLGRAEWMKATAAMLNREAVGNEYFDEAADTYNELVAMAKDEAKKPSVFVNTPWEGVWYMAGGNSYVANYLADAGAEYVWGDDESTGALFLDFEEVLARAQDAAFWLNVGWYPDRAALVSVDSRFAEFEAYVSGNLYNPDLRTSATGASDLYEGAVMRPHQLLADLIAIFHPQLLPDHEYVYYRRLSE